MSQHWYANKQKNVVICVGYDPPLQEYFFNVFDEEDNLLYSFPEMPYFQDHNPGIGNMLKTIQELFPEDFDIRPENQFKAMTDKLLEKSKKYSVDIPFNELFSKLTVDSEMNR